MGGDKSLPMLLGDSRESADWSSRYSVLANLLSDRREQKHLVILQGTPDPDAISSALALDYLGSLFDIETAILTFANVSHHENRAMVKRLGVNLLRYSEGFDVGQYQMYSIVDSQKSYTELDHRLHEHGLEFLAFIDHHRADQIASKALFVDIREHVGSCAAILTEYIKEAAPKGLEPGDTDHVRLATALFHGMRTDTNRLVYATKLEFEAASYLSSCIDSHVIELIERKMLTSSMLGILENALVNRHLHDNFIFSDVGFVRSSDRDVIPQAAELLLSREGTDTVLVYGIVDEKTIDGSFRTRSETINPDEFLKGFLGFSPQSGRYYGGGNVRDKGGFQIPLGFLCLHEEKSQVYAMAREIIEKSFLDYIGKAGKES